MPTFAKERSSQKSLNRRTLIGWGGIRFYLPVDWNMTGFSMERGGGYLKIDSPGSMFVQVKWFNTRERRRPFTILEMVRTLTEIMKLSRPPEPSAPDLRAMLDTFLKDTGKQARKAKNSFDSKVKAETIEHRGERTAHHFTWSGAGSGQGKIWYCAECRRVVIAQVVGRGRDNLADVAASMFGSFTDHADGGWNTWALYDLESEVPEGFVLKSQKLMSGYLLLEFERRGERVRIERWGLANVTRKKFTLAEWFRHACRVNNQRVKTIDTRFHEHDAVRAVGRIKGLVSWFRAMRDSLPALRPASQYNGVVWECGETNKILAVQTWCNRRTEGLLEEVAARCVCH